jgi:hypothetical protein
MTPARGLSAAAFGVLPRHPLLGVVIVPHAGALAVVVRGMGVRSVVVAPALVRKSVAIGNDEGRPRRLIGRRRRRLNVNAWHRLDARERIHAWHRIYAWHRLYAGRRAHPLRVRWIYRHACHGQNGSYEQRRATPNDHRRDSPTRRSVGRTPPTDRGIEGRAHATTVSRKPHLASRLRSPLILALGLRAKPKPQRSQHAKDGLELRIAVPAQRLVKALARHPACSAICVMPRALAATRLRA